MKTPEKVAYIKGLMEGMVLDESKPEVRLLKEIVGVLDELAATNNALTEENIKLRDYVEELDWDLGDLEEYVYDLDGEYDDYDEYDDFDGEEYEYEGEDFGEEDDE